MTEAAPFEGELELDEQGDESVTYSVFATFGVNTDSAYSEIAAANEAVNSLEQFEGVLEEIRGEGIEVRGIYDLTLGSFADPAVCLWLRGPVADDLQWAYRQLLRVFSRYFSTGPISVSTGFVRVPLRMFDPAGVPPCRCPRCSVNSAFNAVSSTFFVSWFSSPPGPTRLTPCSLACASRRSARSF